MSNFFKETGKHPARVSYILEIGTEKHNVSVQVYPMEVFKWF